MVSYRGADGEQRYHETDELNEAIAYVEHLRNHEAVDHARIFELEEVSFEFRPYFRVEIAGAPPVAATGGDSTPWLASAQADDAADDVDQDPLVSAWVASERPEDRDESVPAGMGRRGLFGR